MSLSLSQKLSKRFDDLKIDKKNILQFAEEDLGIILLPAQIAIFKLFYNIPLSNNKDENLITIGDRFNEKVIYEFSEKEFIEFLYNSNRCNVKSSENNLFLEIVFVIGRRGTKTTMSSVITLYTIYLILLLDDPHKYFNILSDDEIGVAIVSNSRDGADRQFRTISKMAISSTFFKKHIAKEPSQGQLFLKSKKQINNPSAKPDILITTFAANPNSRGSNNIVTIADEFHHFLDAEVSSKKNPLDKVVFEALTPSTSGFIHPDGTPAGKNFFISSPNGKKGMLYDMYTRAMQDKQNPSPTTLVINVPSHWVNKNIAPASLKAFFNKSERSFEQEFEAKFIDKTGGWLSSIQDKVYASINKLNPNILNTGIEPIQYFLGIDFGVGHDGSAFAVSHYEPFLLTEFSSTSPELIIQAKDLIVVDYISYLLPQPGQVITLEDIYQELELIHSKYKIIQGGYDQYAGHIFTQLLHDKGYNHLSVINATQQSNSDMAKLFRQLISENRLILPDKPDFTEELFRLKETVSREGLIKVEDTEVHDDQYDAVTRSIWLSFSNRDSSSASFLARSIATLSPANRSNVINANATSSFNRPKTYGGNLRNRQSAYIRRM